MLDKMKKLLFLTPSVFFVHGQDNPVYDLAEKLGADDYGMKM
jgi:hypothetical protein